ncbi:putative phosphoenolpyruvate synthase [Nymphon striatum]|nr:putative phosphoenolpyruvate synthase [Nymphon striatum]
MVRISLKNGPNQPNEWSESANIVGRISLVRISLGPSQGGGRFDQFLQIYIYLLSNDNFYSLLDMDEISFMGVNPSKSNNLHVSLAKRTNNQSEAVISFVVNEDGKRKQFELPQLPRTLSTCKPESGKCWTCQDLKIWNLRTLRSWRISFNGLLREKTSNEVSHVVFNFPQCPSLFDITGNSSFGISMACCHYLKKIIFLYLDGHHILERALGLKFGTLMHIHLINKQNIFTQGALITRLGPLGNRLKNCRYVILFNLFDLNNIHILNKQILKFGKTFCTDNYCQSSKLVGGKGSSLAMLKQIKSDVSIFLVPDGFCITVSANNKHVLENEQLKKKIDRISDICCLEKLFKETKLSESLTGEIHQEMVKLFGEKFENMAFGVRSSAIGEDGEEMSAAGQMETILGCRGLEQIFEGIKKCWASCFGFRAVEYRRQNGQPINVGMGVVVQEMVAADTAGVLFTRDPVNGSPAVISIAANYGIGESVVSAMSEPDTIVVKRTYDNKLSLGERTIGKKKLKIIMKENGGVEESQTSEEDTKSCCLDDEEAIKLAEIGILVEQSYGNPRDIEWAISNGSIFLLQARPITNLHNDSEYMLKNEFNSSMFSEHDCATSGNIKEVFPGAQSLLSTAVMHTSVNMLMPMMYGNNIKGTGKIMKILTKYKKGMDISTDARVFDNKDIDKSAILRYRYGTRFSLVSQMLNGYLMVDKAIHLKHDIIKRDTNTLKKHLLIKKTNLSGYESRTCITKCIPWTFNVFSPFQYNYMLIICKYSSPHVSSWRRFCVYFDVVVMILKTGCLAQGELICCFCS